jgi:hypothetical protein
MANCSFVDGNDQVINDLPPSTSSLMDHDGYLVWAELLENAFQEVLPATRK